MAKQQESYYLPKPSAWPILGSLSLFVMAIGGINWIQQRHWGIYLLFAGSLLFIYMLFGWMGNVIREDRAGLTSSAKVERTFRMAIGWFIFVETMLFAGFLGVFFIARYWILPDLEGHFNVATHLLVWPDFHGGWPETTAPATTEFHGSLAGVNAFGIPAFNTLVLLFSGVTMTIAQWAAANEKRVQLNIGLLLTILLGCVFLFFQYHEYVDAISQLHLTLSSDIYGSTFYMLTGLDGIHVLAGVIMLLVIWRRASRGDFTKKSHFAVDAAAWYWSFITTIWLILFVFVYWV